MNKWHKQDDWGLINMNPEDGNTVYILLDDQDKLQVLSKLPDKPGKIPYYFLGHRVKNGAESKQRGYSETIVLYGGKIKRGND